MATISYTQTTVDQGYNSVIIIKWSGITTTDTEGQWLELPEYSYKTVHIDGNFGTGGVIDMQASNDATLTPFLLTDDRGDTISKNALYGGFIAQNPLMIRPVLSAGSGAVDIDVVVCATTNRYVVVSARTNQYI